VPPIRPKPPAPEQKPIHAPRDTDFEPAHSIGQSPLVLCLYDEVQMILLHRVMYHSKLLAIAIANRAEHGARHLLRAQRATKSAQCDVHRIAAPMLRPRAVRRLPQVRRPWLSPCARPCPATPLHFRKRNRQLLCSHHHLTPII
jgi:hypothetical protein